MSIPGEIQPALTPEEWFAGETESGAGWAFQHDGRLWLTHAFDETEAFFVDNRHALAALCLHGRPFGFTHDDVRMLRKLIAAEERDNALVYDDEREAIRARMPSLADRIEALLPPE